ncbi:MAG TPA: hypothetical protein V6D17_04725 [Candidatus Obscuribacterales bacterium]
MNPEPIEKSHPVDLTGLEDLLDKPHLKVIDAALLEVTEPEEAAEDTSQEKSESQVILELFEHLLTANNLLIETNQRLNVATNRLVQLDEVLIAQSVQLEKLPLLEAKAALVEDLQLKLDLAVSENNWLKRKWINKFFSALNKQLPE